MICSGVIEMFVVRVNPAAFGYRTALVLVRTSNGITKDNVIQRVKQFGDLAFMYIIWEELLWLPLSLIFILVTDKKYYVTRFEEVNIHFDEILPSCRKHIALVLIIMIRTKIVHPFKIS
jgi:DNA-binding Lrp family transcriptional regulator